jgi:hypothetical protein
MDVHLYIEWVSLLIGCGGGIIIGIVGTIVFAALAATGKASEAVPEPSGGEGT